MSDPIQFTSSTSRFALPLLFPGQAQKEAMLNEALVRADFLLHGTVEGVIDAPPGAPVEGECWIVSNAPTGVFADREGSIAGYDGAGWTYIVPREGMRVYDRAAQAFVHYSGTWQLVSVPAGPAGGNTVDTEARTAISALIDAIRSAGILSPGN